MILLATQAEPTMVDHAHDHLGRLVTPREYSSLAATIARGVTWAADNDCFQRLDHVAYDAMLDTLKPHASTCKFVTVPDVVGDALATAHRFETWWVATARRGLPTALVAQDGLEEIPRWLEMVWPRLDALFVGGTTEWKLGSAAESIVRAAKRRALWVHMGRVNSRQRIRYANSIGCDSIDGTSWVKWRDTYLHEGLKYASERPPHQGQLRLRLDGPTPQDTPNERQT